MNDREKERVKENLRDYVESITRKSSGNAYVCPICGSGTGKNHTGAFNIDPQNPTRWTCFKCGKSGDIFDLIGEVEGISRYPEKVKKAEELFGVDTAPVRKAPQGSKMEQQKDYTQYFLQANSRIGDTDYHRGITLETLNRFKVGYDPEWRHPKAPANVPTSPRLIIPTSRYSYIARDTRAELTEQEQSYSKSKAGNVSVFNWKAIGTATRPIVVVEGEIDALSVCDVGGVAVGIGSTSNVRIFLETVKREKPAQPFIISLDNDKAGQEGAEKIAAGLEELGLFHYRWNVAGEYKDANEALNADREAFTELVIRGEQKAEAAAREAQEAERKEYENTSAAAHLQEFVDGVAASAATPAQPTGFAQLDKALDGGLYEGLYFVGAVTSLGKTTFALQIMDQIAQSGRDVIIFSLEMARTELMSKSISRETAQEALEKDVYSMRDAKTARGITAGERYKHYEQREINLIHKAMANYGEYAKHIYIHEGVGSIGVEQIRETVEQHIRLTGNRPVVLVDYVQILAPYDVRATDKQNTDKAVLELKRISRDHKIPVVGISSFNRSNYRESVSFEAFKESGALEYGSDVLIGLQLEGAGGKDFDPTAAKRKDPREIELVILKNRNGRTGETVSYSYYALFNYFEENTAAQPVRKRI